MVPSAFVQLDSLPLTPSQRQARPKGPSPLRTLVLASTERVFIAPRTPTKLLLASLWAGVLNLPSSSSISARDDFFSLGGHSLLATQLVSRVRSSFNVELPLCVLSSRLPPSKPSLLASTQPPFRAPALQVPALVPAERSGPLPLSFAQQRLWFLEQLEQGTARPQHAGGGASRERLTSRRWSAPWPSWCGATRRCAPPSRVAGSRCR